MTSRRDVRGRLRQIDPRDVGAAAVFVVVVVILIAEGRAAGNRSGLRSQDAGSLALLVLASGALVLRRRSPMAVMVVVSGAAYAWWHVIGYDSRAINIPYLVSLYNVALLGSGRRTAIVGASLAVASGGALILSGEGIAIQRWLTGLGWTVASLLFGETVRNRAELAEASEERARRAEAETEYRLVAERLQIAREIHDVLAHTVSVMAVQAEVATDAIDRDQATVRRALGTIRHAARDAMGEVRATVAVLRSPRDRVGTGPAPRIDRVDELVRAARQRGLDVDVEMALSGGPLPEVLELTVYRVVQEALTNVIRHAHTASASVAIREEQERLTVEVRDHGDGASTSVAAGFGLRGMAERVESIGGQLWHGYGDAHGWVVRASLPLARSGR